MPFPAIYCVPGYFNHSQMNGHNWMFCNFQIISHFSDLKMRLLLNVLHFSGNFTVSRLFHIFQIWKRGLTTQMFCIFQIVLQFPDYFAFFKKILSFANSKKWLKRRMHRPSQSLTTTLLRHLGSLGETFLANKYCGMYDSFWKYS